MSCFTETFFRHAWNLLIKQWHGIQFPYTRELPTGSCLNLHTGSDKARRQAWITLYMSLEFIYSTHLVGNCWFAECLFVYPFCFIVQFIRAFRNCSNWKVTKLHSLWDVCISDLISPYTNILLSTSRHVVWGKSSGNSTVRCVTQLYIHHLHSA